MTKEDLVAYGKHLLISMEGFRNSVSDWTAEFPQGDKSIYAGEEARESIQTSLDDLRYAVGKLEEA